jgi:MoxR-like ATPase
MSDSQQPELAGDDLEKVKRLKEAYDSLKQELSKVIVGQDEVVDQLFISLFSRGHALLIGVPGLAKTLMISSLAKVLNLSFNRIQFTPDLMPSDITGTEVIMEDKSTRARASSSSSRDRSSRTSSWPTRSTVRRPRPRPPAREHAGAPGHGRR